MPAPLLQRPILIHIHPKQPTPFHRPQHHAHTALPLRSAKLALIDRYLGGRAVQVGEVRLAALGHVGQEDEEAGRPVAQLARRVELRFLQVVPVQRVLLAGLGTSDLQQLEPLRRDEAHERVGAADDAIGDFVGLVFDNNVAGGALSGFFLRVGDVGSVGPVGAGGY